MLEHDHNVTNEMRNVKQNRYTYRISDVNEMARDGSRTANNYSDNERFTMKERL